MLTDQTDNVHGYTAVKGAAQMNFGQLYVGPEIRQSRGKYPYLKLGGEP